MNVAIDAPKRPSFRYPGAKNRLASWIIGFIPHRHTIHVEAYCGSAAVTLQKERSPIEVINDLNSDVFNFFCVLRERRDELIDAIRFTPFAYQEFELSNQPTDDPLQKARRFYVRAYTAISGPVARGATGWRRQKVLSTKANGQSQMTPAAVTFANINHLYAVAERLRGVFIEKMDALELIRLYDSSTTVHYIDPPYVFDTRSAWVGNMYSHEMEDEHHRQLAAVLLNCEGMVLLSGYACQLYTELYEDNGWQRFDKSARTNGKGSKIESLWLNPATVEALAIEKQEREREALPLLAYANGRAQEPL